MKQLDLNLTVAELVQAYPELKAILSELGFSKILNPLALKAMGQIMTLPRGAAVQNIPLDQVVAVLTEHGFQIVGQDERAVRQARLKGYIERLSKGEALETVCQDFVREFQEVSALEIAEAEQQLIKGGMPIQEVQKLCDVHSAMFHGRTETEVIQDELRTQAAKMNDLSGSNLPAGHPICLMRAENTGMEQVLDQIDAQCVADTPAEAMVVSALQQLNGIRLHYAKKEELLMPKLYDYGVTGPSQVMWGVDDEIKKELGVLTRAVTEDAENVSIYKGRIAALAQRAREMIYKEERILFPLCLRYFTEEEWKRLYRDFPEMGIAFIADPPRWEAGEEWAAAELSRIRTQEILDGRVQLPTGELTVQQLTGIFSLLPVDITFIDAEDRLRFFINEGNIFPRPKAALGREVYECHPPQMVPVVRSLIADFRARKRDSLEVARYIMGKPVLVKYMAVYDAAQRYVGTVEVVQNCEDILAKFRMP